jgi:multisubunit Na+/H+ antiporter MnhE subunit
MRSLILFAATQVMAFFLGSSDTATISLFVFGMAVAVFVSAYLSAYRKDMRNEKRIVKAVFEIQ